MKRLCRLLPCLLIWTAVLCTGSQAEAVEGSAIEVTSSPVNLTDPDPAPETFVNFWAETEYVGRMWIEIENVADYSPTDGVYNSESGQYEWKISETVFDAEGTYTVSYHRETSTTPVATTSVVKAPGSFCPPLNDFTLTSPTPDEDVRFPSVTLEWEPASNSECPDVTYTVTLARFDFDADVEELSAASVEVIFSDPIENEDLEGLQDTILELKNFEPGIYFWKVRAEDGNNEPAETEPRMFQLRPLRLLSPEDGFSIPPQTSSITLFWEDMGASDITYALYVHQYSDEFEYEGTYEYPDLSENFHIFDEIGPLKNYFWKVKAFQDNKAVAESDTYWFQDDGGQGHVGTLQGIIKTNDAFDHSYMLKNLSLSFYYADDMAMENEVFQLKPNDISKNMFLSIDKDFQRITAKISQEKCEKTYRIKVSADGYLPVVVENITIPQLDPENIGNITLRVMGDASDDGEITGDDIKQAFEVFAGFRSADPALDMNYDSKITLEDISIISERAVTDA